MVEFIVGVSYFSLNNLKEINKNMFSSICQLVLDFFVHRLIGEPLHVQVITAGPDENSKGITHSKSNSCVYQQSHVLLRSMLKFPGPLRKL